MRSTVGKSLEIEQEGRFAAACRLPLCSMPVLSSSCSFVLLFSWFHRLPLSLGFVGGRALGLGVKAAKDTRSHKKTGLAP